MMSVFHKSLLLDILLSNINQSDKALEGDDASDRNFLAQGVEFP